MPPTSSTDMDVQGFHRRVAPSDFLAARKSAEPAEKVDEKANGNPTSSASDIGGAAGSGLWARVNDDDKPLPNNADKGKTAAGAKIVGASPSS